MTGDELGSFIQHHMPVGQVVHMTKTGHHKYNGISEDQTRFRFLVPNHINPATPNPKHISVEVLIHARDTYNINQNIIVNNDWILHHLGLNWHGDCRIRILRNLVRLPEFLR